MYNNWFEAYIYCGLRLLKSFEFLEMNRSQGAYHKVPAGGILSSIIGLESGASAKR